WDDSLPAPLHGHLGLTAAKAPCGERATRWRDDHIAVGSWVLIHPNNDPFDANLVPGNSYVAAITLNGAGDYHLDVWSGTKDFWVDP
ncbi:hypothetical protein, partial [Ciceribacter ferrooxidans]|uniref:hypothetical protein n=1 Tax=Ciceribacter ferrooxidans TaxID=2509717 RepID=UPI0013E9DE04